LTKLKRIFNKKASCQHMLKLMASFSVNCPFLFPNFALTWWKKLGSQAATSSSMGTLSASLLKILHKKKLSFEVNL